MNSQVFWGSPQQAQWEAKETLPAKLDLILDQLNIRDRVKDATVAIKMHMGNNIGYSTVHPIFVRKVVQAIKDGGGQPFVTDLFWDMVNAGNRGYTTETLGCPIYPNSGLSEKYCYAHPDPYKNIREWNVAGMIEDADFLINFAHAKGHPSCGYGGVFKNLALGCVNRETRAAMHDTMQFDAYWFSDHCPDEDSRQKVMDSCPFGALVNDKDDPNGVHLHPEQCNQCMRCMEVAPQGSLKISPVNFHAFQEACARSTRATLSTFEPKKVTHLILATQITPLCDCFGFTGPSILPDAGIFGSNDIVAVEQAALDIMAQSQLIEDNIPKNMEIHHREGHPLRWLHGPYKDPYLITQYGEELGLGSRQYDLVDVYPVISSIQPKTAYISTE